MGNYVTTCRKALRTTNLKAIAIYCRSLGLWLRTLFINGKFAHLAGQLDCFTIGASSTNNHMSNIKRFILTVNQLMRAILCMLPYQSIPNATVVHLFQFVLL